ncbi:MAG: Ig-like domain-containing protein [candidate division WOR-3 bacterium]|nr:Ig-like domain-containing protein [candidate division WOR-3 bacterium]
MKMHRIIIGVVLTLMPLAVVMAKPTVRLSVPPPGQHGIEDLWKATVTSDTSCDAWFEGFVFEASHGQVFHATTKPFTLIRGTKVYRYGDVTIGQTQTAPGYEAFVTRKGTLPAGNYRFKLTLQPFGVGDSFGFEVTPAGPPRLISPADGDTISEKYPLFVWTPPMPLPAGKVAYDLKIVEVLPGQTKEEATKSNPPWFEQSDYMATSFRYPTSAKALEARKRYAWMVSAKQPRGEVSVSESWSFSTGKPAGPRIVSVTPPEGTEDAPYEGLTVTATCNVPIDSASVTWSVIKDTAPLAPPSIMLIPDYAAGYRDAWPRLAAAGSFSLSHDKRTLSFTPSGQVAPATHYLLVVSGLKDRKGGEIPEFASSFSTKPVLRVTGASLKRGSVCGLQDTFWVKLSRPLSGVKPGQVLGLVRYEVRDSGKTTETPVPANVWFSDGATTVNISPVKPLQPRAAHALTISSGNAPPQLRELVACRINFYPRPPEEAKDTMAIRMTVSPEGAGHTWPPEGLNILEAGSLRAISVMRLPGYRFVRWDCHDDDHIDDSEERQLFFGHSAGSVWEWDHRIWDDLEITAVFEPAPKYHLTTGSYPNGGGTVTASLPEPAGGYVDGTKVHLYATANDGYYFDKWLGDGTVLPHGDLNNNGNTVVYIKMNENRAATATFKPSPRVLHVSVAPPDGGSTIPTVGDHEYATGDHVTLHADAAAGYVFDGWELNGTGPLLPNDYDLELTGPTTAKAVFERAKYTLTIASAPVNNASVGTITPGRGAHLYDASTPVTVVVTGIPDGWVFDHWECPEDLDLHGLMSPTSPTFYGDRDRTLTAVFRGVFEVDWISINGTRHDVEDFAAAPVRDVVASDPTIITVGFRGQKLDPSSISDPVFDVGELPDWGIDTSLDYVCRSASSSFAFNHDDNSFTITSTTGAAGMAISKMAEAVIHFWTYTSPHSGEVHGVKSVEGTVLPDQSYLFSTENPGLEVRLKEFHIGCHGFLDCDGTEPGEEEIRIAYSLGIGGPSGPGHTEDGEVDATVQGSGAPNTPGPHHVNISPGDPPGALLLHVDKVNDDDGLIIYLHAIEEDNDGACAIIRAILDAAAGPIGDYIGGHTGPLAPVVAPAVTAAILALADIIRNTNDDLVSLEESWYGPSWGAGDHTNACTSVRYEDCWFRYEVWLK